MPKKPRSGEVPDPRPLSMEPKPLPKFHVEDMPSDCRPVLREIGSVSSWLTLNAEMVEFREQTRKELVLELKGRDHRWSDEFHRELRAALGPECAEIALWKLSELQTLRFLQSAFVKE